MELMRLYHELSDAGNQLAEDVSLAMIDGDAAKVGLALERFIETKQSLLAQVARVTAALSQEDK